MCRLKEHKADVTNVDLLIEPHHGRKFGRSYDFLDTLKPKVTIFGNVNSEHLAYGAWSSGNGASASIRETRSTVNHGYFTMTVLSASMVTVFVTAPCPLRGIILTS